jgi:hypothetical protein
MRARGHQISHQLVANTLARVAGRAKAAAMILDLSDEKNGGTSRA